MLNWIFVDADSRVARHAGRKDSIGHVIGPWGWTEDERWLTLRGSEEGFVAVKEAMKTATEGEETVLEEFMGDRDVVRWTIYWDPDGILRGQKEAEGKNCVPVTLRRRMKLGMESKYVKGDKESREQA